MAVFRFCLGHFFEWFSKLSLTYLHVQKSIRQSAIQLFSEAFSAWKLDGATRIIASQLFKSLASTLARISQQMMLRSKTSTYPCDWPDKIVGIVVKIVVKTKWGQPTNKKIQRFLTWNRWIYGPAEPDKSELVGGKAPPSCLLQWCWF